jgi:Flp pilus assembly protein TadB
MSKIGVGVGEDFPVDETKPAETGPGTEKPRDDEEARYCDSREDYRREHDEWRDRKRAFKEEMRRRLRGRFGDHHHHSFGGHRAFVAVAAIVAVILAFALIPHLFTIALVAVALAVLFIAAQYHLHHHHYGDYGLPPHDADV